MRTESDKYGALIFISVVRDFSIVMAGHGACACAGECADNVYD